MCVCRIIYVSVSYIYDTTHVHLSSLQKTRQTFRSYDPSAAKKRGGEIEMRESVDIVMQCAAKDSYLLYSPPGIINPTKRGDQSLLRHQNRSLSRGEVSLIPLNASGSDV